MKEQPDNICKEQLFEEIFRQHSTDLFNFIYYKYGEEVNPADVVQDAYSKLWENCSTVSNEKAKSYLFTVANNLTLNIISRNKTALAFSKQDQKSATSETPQYKLEEEEYGERLKNALASLTEEQRVTFMLNRVEGKRHKEIAEMLGISRKAVEKRIYKALSILREKIGEI